MRIKLKYMRAATMVSAAWVLVIVGFTIRFATNPGEYRRFLTDAPIEVTANNEAVIELPSYETKYKDVAVQVRSEHGEVHEFRTQTNDGRVQFPLNGLPAGKYEVKATATCTSDNPIIPPTKEVNFTQQLIRK
jgi:hypothetical protein